MRTVGRAALPLAVLGAVMIAAAVLPAMGAHAATADLVSVRPSTAAATVSAAPAQDARKHPGQDAPHRHATTTRHATHVVRRVVATASPTGAAVTPASTPSATHTATPRPTSTAHSTAGRRTAPAHRAATRTAHASGPTGWTALNAAIARIPTYHAGQARWVISSRYGHWGTADWYHATMYIAPDVPSDQLFNVVVHEWSHELSVLDYDGNVAAATAAMNKAFGGTGLVGAERAADCMARLQGATWTHYTSCTDQNWRTLAAKLVAGHQL
jgi:hypothetical protein